MIGRTTEGRGLSRRRILDRRMFIRDFGRGVLGISIGGVLLAACGDGADTVSSTAASGTSQSSSPASTDVTSSTAAPTTTTSDVATTQGSASRRLDVNRVALGFVSAYVMVRETEAAIVDTGNPGSAPLIEKALVEVGLGWGSVATVILTHRHPDHVGSLNAVLAEATEAIVGTGAADLGGISSDRALVAFEDGQEVFGSTIIATPGHTEGHISVWDAETSVLIAGDALNGIGVETIDGVGGANPQFTPDMTLAADSIRKMAALEPDTIYFGHGDPKLGDAVAALNAVVAGL